MRAKNYVIHRNILMCIHVHERHVYAISHGFYMCSGTPCQSTINSLVVTFISLFNDFISIQTFDHIHEQSFDVAVRNHTLRS